MIKWGDRAKYIRNLDRPTASHSKQGPPIHKPTQLNEKPIVMSLHTSNLYDFGNHFRFPSYSKFFNMIKCLQNSIIGKYLQKFINLKKIYKSLWIWKIRVMKPGRTKTWIGLMFLNCQGCVGINLEFFSASSGVGLRIHSLVSETRLGQVRSQPDQRVLKFFQTWWDPIQL